jgi:hypothetical protein
MAQYNAVVTAAGQGLSIAVAHAPVASNVTMHDVLIKTVRVVNDGGRRLGAWVNRLGFVLTVSPREIDLDNLRRLLVVKLAFDL